MSVYPWRSWRCDDHEVFFSATTNSGDYAKCVMTNCKAEAFHVNGTGSNGVWVRSLLFDHENYPWIPVPYWLPEYMREDK